MIPEAWMKGPLMWAALALMLIAILLAAVWDLATDQAEQRVRAEQSTQSHIEYAEDRIDEKCLSLEPVALRDCIHKEVEAARDHDRSNQDLYAQQQMAFFTKIMGATAIAGLFLGLVSIVVIFATLREMGNTNKIMREDQRPWLIIQPKGTPFKVLSRMYRSDPHRDLTLTVTNKGRLPARNAVATYITFSHDTIDTDEVGDFVEDAIAKHGNLETSTVFQNETTTLRITPLDPSKRVLGHGERWSLMVVCIYYWEEELKMIWTVVDTKRPPSNILNKQKS